MRITTTRAGGRRLGRVTAVAAALALTLAACGGGNGADDADDAATGGGNGSGDDGGTGGESAPETTELLVGIIPVIEHASVFVAIDRGYFAEEGLDVTAQPVQGGAAAVPVMIAGDMQGAFATYPSFLLAQQGGVDITIVAEGVRGTEQSAGVYVAEDSDLQSIEDIEGRIVAVNTLNNVADFTIKYLLEEVGGDPSAVQFIELAFPDMTPTLLSGGVDAVWLVEPFRTSAEAEGARMLFPTYQGPTAEIPVSGIGMTTEFVEANPNTVAGFVRAIERANADIAADPEIAREIVITYSSITPELAEQMQLSLWTAEPASADNLQIWNDLMVEQGALSAPVDMERMVYRSTD